VKSLKDMKAELLAKPAVRQAYDAQAPEFELARELIAARTQAGLTQGEVAARMGTTQSVVARHGQTIGYFIPTHGQADADVASLQKASTTLDSLLAAKRVDVEAVVADFKSARKGAKAPKKSASK
jgi:predicted transcriptional regulator